MNMVFETRDISLDWNNVTSFVFIFEITNRRHNIHKYVPIMDWETKEIIVKDDIPGMKFGGDYDRRSESIRFWFYDERTGMRRTLAVVGNYNFLQTDDDIVNYTMSLDLSGVEHEDIPINLEVL